MDLVSWKPTAIHFAFEGVTCDCNFHEILTTIMPYVLIYKGSTFRLWINIEVEAYLILGNPNITVKMHFLLLIDLYVKSSNILISFNPQDKRFAAHDTIKNRRLLWHGTNVAVVAAILKSGLRIMPHSGGRVGRGIYFASEHSKSAGYGKNYCYEIVTLKITVMEL